MLIASKWVLNPFVDQQKFKFWEMFKPQFQQEVLLQVVKPILEENP